MAAALTSLLLLGLTVWGIVLLGTMTPCAAWFLLGTLAGVVLMCGALIILDYLYWSERP